MFTKKHYKAIANIIKLEYIVEVTINDKHTETVHQILLNISSNLADYFENEYAGYYEFDRNKFLSACGVA